MCQFARPRGCEAVEVVFPMYETKSSIEKSNHIRLRKRFSSDLLFSGRFNHRGISVDFTQNGPFQSFPPGETANPLFTLFLINSRSTKTEPALAGQWAASPASNWEFRSDLAKFPLSPPRPRNFDGRRVSRCDSLFGCWASSQEGRGFNIHMSGLEYQHDAGLPRHCRPPNES